MPTIDLTAEVKSGLLLQLPTEAESLHLKAGDKVHIRLESVSDAGNVNQGMLDVLREIAERQKGRRHTDGSTTDEMLREARAGAMWGHDPVE